MAQVLNADDVRVGVTGGISVAPSGTALPISAAASLNAAFDDLGYISDAGVEQAINETITSIKAWQNGAVVRKVQTEHDVTYHFTMIETNSAVLAQYYGNFSGGKANITGSILAHQAWILDVIDGSDLIRVVIADGQITERGNIVYKNDTAVGYEVTITAYPDANNVKAIVYLGGPDS